MRRGWVMSLFLVGVLASTATAATAQDATPAPTGGLGSTFFYREISAFTTGPDSGGEQSPILSADGTTVAYGVAPGSGSPDPNRVFVVHADGTDQHQVDAYQRLCDCGSAIEVSADGGTVIASDSVQLRIADAGGGRQLLALNSNEINAIALSGDGQWVFFRVYRDASVRGSSPEQALERGVWVIGADGSGLRQIVNPRQLVALGLPPTDFVGSIGGTMEASTDGSRLVFGAYDDPQEGGVGQGVFGVNRDGSGLRQYGGRVARLNAAALSADGTTVAYAATALGTYAGEVAVVPFGGGAPRVLLTEASAQPAPQNGIPSASDRMQLSTDGTKLLLGSSGVLADTASGALLQLGVADAALPSGIVRLVGDGLYLATMSGDARRVLFLSSDAHNVRQLALLDIDPAQADPALTLADAVITQAPGPGRTAATVTVRVVSTGTITGVGANALLEGLADRAGGYTELNDAGKDGDAIAGDGVYTSQSLAANCCAVAGARTVRVQAQAVDAGGRRLTVAVDLPGYTVAATPTP